MNKLTHVDLKHFTAFSSLDLDLSPGINVFIGANGTGKTHLLKILYAACAVTSGEDKERGFAAKLLGVFNPYQGRMTRLIRRQQGLPASEVVVVREGGIRMKAILDNRKADSRDVKVFGQSKWQESRLESAYIPVKEMLAHAPGFLSTVKRREIAFEDVYSDIIHRAFLPQLRGQADQARKRVLSALQKIIEGKVVSRGEYFFLKNKQGELEFTLLAEGIRKLALIWLLIQNGTLLSGSVLFWDEPEANLNPHLMGELVEVILELQRIGVQVFLTTHNYVVLKELDLRRTHHDTLRFFSFHRDSQGAVVSAAADNYLDITPNLIATTFDSLYDRELDRDLKGSPR